MVVLAMAHASMNPSMKVGTDTKEETIKIEVMEVAMADPIKITVKTIEASKSSVLNLVLE
jgi:hypothetical protein